VSDKKVQRSRTLADKKLVDDHWRQMMQDNPQMHKAVREWLASVERDAQPPRTGGTV
jgi:hypothetical protein